MWIAKDKLCAGVYHCGLPKTKPLNLVLQWFILVDETKKYFRQGLKQLLNGMTKIKIISGGQTGADRAALDAALELRIPHGGWLPWGRKAEDGPVSHRYNLLELASPKYRDRTRKNIQSSDGTLIISFGPLTGGSALTEALAIRYDRPCLRLDMAVITEDKAGEAVEKWLRKFSIAILNVAGPRASGEPEIYDTVKRLLLSVDWDRLDGERSEEEDEGIRCQHKKTFHVLIPDT